MENRLTAEIESLKTALDDRYKEICSLQISNKVAKETSEKLNKRLTDNRNKYEQDKTHQLKEHRNEVKAWKKDLGEANSKIIKLEKKLKAADTRDLWSCSTKEPISASNPSSHPPISLPMDSQSPCSDSLNPVFDTFENVVKDEDSVSVHNESSCRQVCVTRQPLPPPFPSITHLLNELSLSGAHYVQSWGPR